MMKPKCGLPRRYPLCPRLAQGLRGHAPLTVHFLDGEQITIGDRSLYLLEMATCNVNTLCHETKSRRLIQKGSRHNQPGLQ